MKKLRTIVSVWLVLFMLAALLAACGRSPAPQPTDASVTTGTTTGTTAEQTTTEKEQRETVHLRIAWDEPQVSTALDANFPTDVIQEIFNAVDITYEVDGMDQERFQVLLAGGDLPDMLFLRTVGLYNEQLIEGGHIIALDQLVNEYGPYVTKNSPTRVENSIADWSLGRENLYFIPTNHGINPEPYNIAAGYWVRWDLYKELGYPKIKDDIDYLNVLAQMQELYPETEEGRRTYGTATWNDWGLTGISFNNFREGFQDSFHDVRTNEWMDVWGDVDRSSFWSQIRFLRQANKMGLLDPDSFTMNWNDYLAKVSAGQILGPWVSWVVGGYNNDNLESGKGFMPVPVEGSTVWVPGGLNRQVTAGGKAWAITKNCEHPERAMEFINFLRSEEGLRLIYSGIKGVHWDYVDGKPQMLPEGIEVINDAERNEKVGIGQFGNWRDLGGIIAYDGEIMDLSSTPDVMSLRVKGVEKDFIEHYNVDFPFQAFGRLIEQGKMFDQSNHKNVVPYTEPDEELRFRLEKSGSDATELMTRALPRLILAKDDDEYLRIKEETLGQLENLGWNQHVEWRRATWQIVE